MTPTKLSPALLLVLSLLGPPSLESVVFAQAQAREYPPALQNRLLSLMGRQGAGALRAVRERYGDSGLPAFRELLGKRGFSEAEAASIVARYVGNQAQWRPLPARLQDDSLLIEASGNRVEVGPMDLWSRSIRVNGKRFAWDWQETPMENLGRYDRLFTERPRSTLQSMGPVSSAWADEAGQLFQIQASGLQLYFLVGAVGEIGEELYRLNGKVKEMLKACKSPEPKPDGDDPLLKAVLQGTADAQAHQGDRIKLRNCDDLKALARAPVRRLGGERVYPRLPADLCGNLDALAVCVHEQMDPASVSNGKIKRPADRGEWYQPPEKASSGGRQAN